MVAYSILNNIGMQNIPNKIIFFSDEKKYLLFRKIDSLSTGANLANKH